MAIVPHGEIIFLKTSTEKQASNLIRELIFFKTILHFMEKQDF